MFDRVPTSPLFLMWIKTKITCLVCMNDLISPNLAVPIHYGKQTFMFGLKKTHAARVVWVYSLPWVE